MAIALDQSSIGEAASDTAGGTVALVTSQNVASAGFVVLGVSFLTGQTLSSVAGGGLAWTIDKQAAGGTISVALVSAQAPAGLASGSTLTATFSASTAGGRSIWGTSFTGVKAAAPAEASDAHTGAATTAWTSNPVAQSAGSLLIAASANSTGLFTSTATAPAGKLHDFGNGGFSVNGSFQLAGGAGSNTIAGTWSNAANSETVTVSYLAALLAAISGGRELLGVGA